MIVSALADRLLPCGQNGMVGVGITIGGEPAAFIVENHLSRFVEGQVRVASATCCWSCSSTHETGHRTATTWS